MNAPALLSAFVVALLGVFGAAVLVGDLAFLHVHRTAGDAARFETTLPTAGRYRLFLQFKAAGRVHTAAFTREAAR
jgi:hypothetical protein